jgi:uncharacterized protein YjbJ (UPF0337 family)
MTGIRRSNHFHNMTRVFDKLRDGEEGKDMNRDIVEGNWKQFMGKMRVRWSMLIGDHLGVVTGKRTQLAGARQRSYGVFRSSGAVRAGYPARAILSNRTADREPRPTTPIRPIHTRGNS